MTNRLAALVLASAIFASAVARSAESDAEWIVVTAPAFRSAIEPLCEYRRSEGMHVDVVQTTEVLTPKQIHDSDAQALKDRIHELCERSKGRKYVLLVGAIHAGDKKRAETTVVPPLRGTSGRMQGEPSDNGYGSPDKLTMPTVAVGRFPARSALEVEQMVQKTLAFERDRSAGAWRNRLTMLVGHPGGASEIEKRFAESFLQGVAGTRFGKIDPMWTANIIIHATGSPFTVPDAQLHTASKRDLQDGQIFSVYLGHSNAGGLWSANAPFLSRDDWAELNISEGAGVFVSCGCFGCQLEGRDGEGYGLTAMRNPHGPVAVIGSHGESYAALGQLAADGMLQCLNRSSPPERLAEYWLAATAGMARGKIDPLTFWLYDQGDGSRGAVPLDKQRLEHLEMWMLLGDPAMRLPICRPAIPLEVDGDAVPGKSLRVRGGVPEGFAGSTLQVTLETLIGSKPKKVEDSHSEPSDQPVLQSFEVPMKESRFECQIELPQECPWPRLVVRAVAISKLDRAQGVTTINIKPK